MAIFTIGDPHLAFSVDKPMDVFRGWDNHVQRLEEGWRTVVSPEDTVVVVGDISWGISLEQALEDFRFLHGLPGNKIFLKGNHDYWWSTKNKMDLFLEENNLHSIRILNNNAYEVEGMAICGTRGWIFEKGQPHDQRIVAREAGRLRLSLEDGQKCATPPNVVFLHYPPVYGEELCAQILDVLLEYKIKQCFYGHIHARGCDYALNGSYLGIDFRLVSGDFVNFIPILVK